MKKIIVTLIVAVFISTSSLNINGSFILIANAAEKADSGKSKGSW